MSPKNPKVSVVIANYNGEDLLKKNLSKIVELKDNPKNLISEIILVDDGSADGSADFVKKNFPEIRLFKHKTNRGVASALNTGVRSAKGELILMISTDMTPKINLAEILIPHFDDAKVFSVAFHEEGVGPEKAVWKDGFLEFSNIKESKEFKPVFYVRKGSGMFRRKYWIELGGMDEKLFLPFYWEDLDIGYRAAKRSYKNLWEPKAMVIHEHWGTVGKFPKNFINKTGDLHMLLFIWKNITSSNLTRRHVAGLFLKIFKNPIYLLVIFKAISKMGIVLKERKKEVHESIVSDEAVFSRFSG